MGQICVDRICFTELNIIMALGKSDLKAIDTIVAKRIEPLEKRIVKMDRKFDKFLISLTETSQ